MPTLMGSETGMVPTGFCADWHKDTDGKVIGIDMFTVGYDGEREELVQTVWIKSGVKCPTVYGVNRLLEDSIMDNHLTRKTVTYYN